MNDIDADKAFDYVTNEMTMELLDWVCEHCYDEIRDYVFEQEASNRDL